jgi:hypothetical protein
MSTYAAVHLVAAPQLGRSMANSARVLCGKNQHFRSQRAVTYVIFNDLPHPARKVSRQSLQVKPDNLSPSELHSILSRS